MFKRIWAMSDLHGSSLPIKNFYNRNVDKIKFSAETDLIILLGDVGANYFQNHRDRDFKKKLSSFPFTYFCIRGNHEMRASVCANQNRDDWEEKPIFNNITLVEKQYPKILYALDDVAIYNIEEYKTLIIPGAYSVDKEYRINHGWSWFPDEQLSELEKNIGRIRLERSDYNFDLVLSHTCPIAYEPRDLFLPQIDQSKVDKSMEFYLGEIEYQISYKLWLWGHFHQYRVYPFYNDDKHGRSIMLSAGEEAINVKEWIQDLEGYHQRY